MALKECKRKSTLKKKASELATLCDVRVCMVCFGPDESGAETRPEQKTEVLGVINMYCKRVISDQKGNRIKLSWMIFLGSWRISLIKKSYRTARGRNLQISIKKTLMATTGTGMKS